MIIFVILRNSPPSEYKEAEDRDRVALDLKAGLHPLKSKFVFWYTRSRRTPGVRSQASYEDNVKKIVDFSTVNESFPFTIDMSWKSESHNATGDNHQSVTVFPKGNSIPSVKALTLNRPGTFTMDVKYADASQMQAPAKISTYTIGPFQSTKCEKAKLLDEEEIDVPVVKEARKMDTNEAPVNTAGSDVNMEDAKGTYH